MATTYKYFTQKQFLKKLHIVNLKGLQDVTIVFEDEKGCPQWITGIFGMNGSGKTTILQTILCLYRPQKGVKGEEDNTKMSRFFKSVNGSNWNGSSYEAEFQHELIRQTNPVQYIPEVKLVHFYKSSGKKGEWKVRQTNKYDRPVFYIPVSTCLPVIETIGQNTSSVTFNATDPQNINQAIVDAASYVTGNKYTLAQSVKTWEKPCLIVQTHKGSNPTIQYHSFHMGAGEQRVFRILEKLYTAPNNSLFVIDELDITLHTAALKRLIQCMYKRARDKHIQIVFCSHRQELMDMKEVNTYYLLQTQNGVSCMHNPTSDCYDELTGDQTKDYTVYVEDDLSKAIVQQELIRTNKFARVRIKRFGSIQNAFTIAAGLVCSIHEDVLQDTTIAVADKNSVTFERISKYIILLDGDRYVTPQEKSQQICNALSGNDPNSRQRRFWMTSIIHQYCSVTNPNNANMMLSPDVFIHNTFEDMYQNQTWGNYQAIIQASHAIQNVLDTHDYIDNLISQGYSYTDVINAFVSSNNWSNYVTELTRWCNRLP